MQMLCPKAVSVLNLNSRTSRTGHKVTWKMLDLKTHISFCNRIYIELKIRPFLVQETLLKSYTRDDIIVYFVTHIILSRKYGVGQVFQGKIATRGHWHETLWHF